MRTLIAAAGCLLGALVLYPMPSAAAERHALLVGISDYRSEQIPRLDGPAHDLVAFKRALRAEWGFDAHRVQTLLNSQASLEALQQGLSRLRDAARAGDYVFFYFSGHGTSAHDPAELWPMPYGTGAFVPHDAEFAPDGRLDRVLSGREHIRPVLEALDRKGVTTLVVLDTCFSEHATRQYGTKARYRVIERPRVDGGAVRGTGASPSGHTTRRDDALSEPYPYENVFMISAAAKDERALDLDRYVIDRYPTYDGMPHGALSDSMLRILLGKPVADSDVDTPLSHRGLFEAIRKHMDARGFEQNPKAYPVSRSIAADVLGKVPLFASGARP